MTILTRHLGEIDIDESKIIEFKEGIPGFEGLKSFALFHDEENGNGEAFMWLQSLDDTDVTFVLLNTFAFMPQYKPILEDSDISDLGEFGDEDLLIRNIAVIHDKLENTTVNLKAPIIINAATKLGKQAIAKNEEYHIRHYIFIGMEITEETSA